jgi:L-lactate dehydrogenase complex protein LldG
MVEHARVSEARQTILNRVRGALVDVPPDERAEDVAVPRQYRRQGDMSSQERLARFEDRLRDYGGAVRRVSLDQVASAVDTACDELGLATLVVAPELRAAWRPAKVRLHEDHGLTADELDRVDGALTGCAVAIAETGSLVLDGQGSSGRRAITLVPDHHICVVTSDQIVELVPEAIARVAPGAEQAGRPVTLISGPSASSDIELVRVEGVHGPRHLLVLIALKSGSETANTPDDSSEEHTDG